MVGLTEKQKQRYDEEGFVLLKGLFDPDELSPLVHEIEDAIDRVGREYYAKGRIKSLYESDGFKTRFLRMTEDSEDIYDDVVGSRLMGPELFNLLSHPRHLDIVEGIVGHEVHCEGRHRLRPKLPNYDLADFRWHEDTRFQARRIIHVEQPYGLGPSDPAQSGRIDSRIVAVPQMAEPNFWIPLVDVDEQNGCLHMLPGGHLHAPPFDRQSEQGRSTQQLNGLVPTPVPMQVGDAILIHQHLPHVSPPNRSGHVRWSVDIRYQDGRLPTKSSREPGFLARSQERPQDVVTKHEGYVRIREAAEEFQLKTKMAVEEFELKTKIRL